MSDHTDQNSYTGDIDEDEILAGLSAEELKELEKEMDVIAPDERVPVGMRQKDSSQDTASRGNKEQEEEEEEEEEDIDEDTILAGLSADELKQLQSEMDVIAPDERVPVGMRQKDQTEKAPTGTFDHRSLVDYLYWERESKRMLEEERVPATLLPSQRKMEEEVKSTTDKQDGDAEEVEYVYEEIIEEVEGADAEEVIEEVIEEVVEVDDDKKEKQDGEIPKSEVEKNNTLVSETKQETLQSPPELSDSKVESQAPNEVKTNEADEKKLDQPQLDPAQSPYENWVPQKEERVISKLKIPKLALGDGLVKKTARPSGNETNLESTLEKIRRNSPSVTEVNLNNIENIPKEMLLDYVEALKKNKYVKSFSIANTGADENVAFTLANMLRENRSITTLNIESNFITGKGIIAVMRCLQFNETLTELRFHNQRYMLGHHAETEVSRLLKANNTLLKMGYHFELPGPRMVVTNLLTRNLDRQRQQRKEEQRLQQMKEQRQMMEMYESSLNLPPGLLEMLGGYVPGIELLQATQNPQEVQKASPEPSPVPSPHQQLRKIHHPPREPPPTTNSDSNYLLKDVHLKKTPKRRDPFLDLNLTEEKREGRVNVQLRSTPKEKNTSSEALGDERANLKDVIKTLKPVPRRRQPPKVDLTPRDMLLSEIRQSNVAYLKSVPLPKVLESRETSLF